MTKSEEHDWKIVITELKFPWWSWLVFRRVYREKFVVLSQRTTMAEAVNMACAITEAVRNEDNVYVDLYKMDLLAGTIEPTPLY